jgi:PPOX class probable F420-dependent enzyme
MNMKITQHLPSERRSHVEARLSSDPLAWLTTVSPDGQPASVPVWFLIREDESILVYSRPNQLKLRNIAQNPRVALGLDGTAIGRDVIRLHGTAHPAEDIPPAHQNPPYVAKYADLMSTVFGTADQMAALYSVALLVVPTRLWA